MKRQHEHADSDAPFMGSWKNIYLFVLIFLVLTILFIYFFCEQFK